MSVKEFFAYSNIKQAVVEFLKNKGNFESLQARHKKPFRAHINKHNSSAYVPQTVALNTVLESVAIENNLNTSAGDFFASDGFNSIKCQFSE